MDIHEFYRAMVNVSIGLAQDLMVDRLLGNTRVSMTKKGYRKITKERNHLVTLELLASKWGIALEKSKYAFTGTTQDCIRSALLPITRRYRNDLIS